MHSIYTTVNLNNKKEFILHNKLTWISSFTSICQCLFDWHCYLLCFLLDQWGKWLLPLRDVLLAGYYGITADNGICLLLDTLLEEKVAVLLRENGRQKRLQSEKKWRPLKSFISLKACKDLTNYPVKEATGLSKYMQITVVYKIFYNFSLNLNVRTTDMWCYTFFCFLHLKWTISHKQRKPTRLSLKRNMG